MLLAQELYGLDGHGIDRVPDYVQAARELGVSAEQADAITWRDYGRYDILYLNKPCHGPLEYQLERRVMDLMKPGAVLIMANAADRPPADWEPVAIEWDTQQRGVGETWLNAGCGTHQPDGWLHLDHDPDCSPDIIAGLDDIPFGKARFQRVFCSHVLEHLDYFTLLPQVLSELRR